MGRPHEAAPWTLSACEQLKPELHRLSLGLRQCV